MKFEKNDIIALIVSIIFHLSILLVLYFTVLKTIVPEEDSGIMVNFGNVNLAAGQFEPRGEPASSDMTAAPPPQPAHPTPREEMITQDLEESVSLTNKKNEEERKKKEKKEQEEARRKETEQRKVEAERKKQTDEQRRKEQAIRDRVAGAFGSTGGSENNNQGDAASGSGNQGSPFGNSDSGANEGVGGIGSFNLNGRSIGAGGLPKPAYTIQEEGRIVINITVDPRGNVIMAEIGKGTNIDHATMRKSALEAARKAKFNSIQGTNNQSGTITYRYSLR
jgi:tonB family C-terminal domain